jgi:hypothetical protein
VSIDFVQAGLEILGAAKMALVSGLAGAAGRALSPEVRDRIERAFLVILAYAIERATTLEDLEAIARLEVGADAPAEVVAAADVLASYASAAEAIARHVAAEVVKATASATGTVAAKVAIAFARTLLASLGIPLPTVTS